MVDAQCRTNDPDIFAAGDSARYDNPFSGTEIRLESVQNAVDQAKVIAQVITGQQAEYHSVPWFWSDQYDIKLQMVGIHEGYTHFYQRGERSEERRGGKEWRCRWGRAQRQRRVYEAGRGPGWAVRERSTLRCIG